MKQRKSNKSKTYWLYEKSISDGKQHWHLHTHSKIDYSYKIDKKYWKDKLFKT